MDISDDLDDVMVNNVLEKQEILVANVVHCTSTLKGEI